MDDESDTPTEWLANGPTGYGWGRTQYDAVLNMLGAMDPWRDDIDEIVVDTVEHRGDATVRPGSWRVDEFVSGERLTFDADEAAALRDRAVTVVGSVTRLVDMADADDLD